MTNNLKVLAEKRRLRREQRIKLREERRKLREERRRDKENGQNSQNTQPTPEPTPEPEPVPEPEPDEDNSLLTDPSTEPSVPSKDNAKIKKLKLQPEFKKHLEDAITRVNLMEKTENGKKYIMFCENFWKKLSKENLTQLTWDYFCRASKWSLKAGTEFLKVCSKNPQAVLGAMLLCFVYKLYGWLKAAGEAAGEAVKSGALYALNQTIFVAGTATDKAIVAVNIVKTAVSWFFKNIIYKMIAKLTGLVGKQLLIAYNKIVGEGTGAALLDAPSDKDEVTVQDDIEAALSQHDLDWQVDPEEEYGKILNGIDENLDVMIDGRELHAELQLQEEIEEANKRLRIGESVANTKLHQYIDRGEKGKKTLQDLSRQIKEDQEQFSINNEYEGNKKPYWMDRRSKAQITLGTMNERLDQINDIQKAQTYLKGYLKKFNLLKQRPQLGVQGLQNEDKMLSEIRDELAGLWNSRAVKLLRESRLDPRTASEIFVTQLGKLIVATVTAQQAVVAGLLQHYQKKVSSAEQRKKSKSKQEKFEAKLKQLRNQSEKLKTQQRELSRNPLIQVEFMKQKPMQVRQILIDYVDGQNALSGGASSGQLAIAAPVVADVHANSLQKPTVLGPAIGRVVRPPRLDYTSRLAKTVAVRYDAGECEEETN